MNIIELINKIPKDQIIEVHPEYLVVKDTADVDLILVKVAQLLIEKFWVSENPFNCLERVPMFDQVEFGEELEILPTYKIKMILKPRFRFGIDY